MSSTTATPSARPARPARPPRPGRATGSVPVRPALRRPRRCALTGVSAGLAAHLGAPVWAVRAFFIGATAMLGAGALLYLWCWAFIPWAPGSDAPTRRVPVAWILTSVAAVLVVTVMPTTLDPWAWTVWGWLTGRESTVVLAFAVILAVAGGVWATLIDRADPGRGVVHARLVRIAVTVLFAILFVVELISLASGGGLLQAIRTATPLAGLVVVLASALIGPWRELNGERVARIREEQRAEMAAHLHDSVLQTLALIQNRAGASSEAARLARAQERELRAWLYDGDAPADSDLPTDLRDYAGALELDYPVRIDLVSAGESTERASGEVAAAAREAMLNAARHAGGEISVYLEGSAHAVDVYIRDRGPGFDPDAVPADRLGVRESIIGRLRRIGGTATIRSGATGTEVHLHFVTQGFVTQGFVTQGFVTQGGARV